MSANRSVQAMMMEGRTRAGQASTSHHAINRGVNRVLALVEGTKRKEPIMSVADCEIEETDKELCEEHPYNYRPCRQCKRQEQIERAEGRKEESGR